MSSSALDRGMCDIRRTAVRSHTVAVPIRAAALALSACGSGRMATPGRPAPPRRRSRSVSSRRYPVTSRLGKGIQHSVELAVMQANEANAIPGWEIKVEPVDDEGKPRSARTAWRSRPRTTRSPRVVVGNPNQRVPADPAGLRGRQHRPDLADNTPGAHDGRDLKSRPTSRSSAPAPRTSSRASSRPSSCSTRASSRSRRSTTRRPTVGPGHLLHEAFKAGGGTIVAAETINPDESNYGPVVSKVAPSKPKRSTTAVSTRRAGRSRSR